MQFNTDLLQTLSLNTQKASSSVEGAVSAEANASGEFLSLLTEAKELAKSGVVSPNEFMASLSDESLSLNPNEKKALAKSFMDFMPKTEAKQTTSLPQEMTTEEMIPMTKEEASLQAVLGTSVATKNVKVAPKLMTTQQAVVDTSNTQAMEQMTEQEEINPKISNGKLFSIKAHKAQKMPVSSAQDFVMQNQALGKATSPEQAVAARKSFFPKSKSQVNAFNKEQNVISKSVFGGKNPFTQVESNPLNTSNITSDEAALFQAVEGAEQSGELQNLMMSSTAAKTVASNTAPSMPTNVLDLSSLNPQNSEQIIEKISDYITTSRLENQDSVDLLVKHESLGQFKVTASKGALPDQVNLEIAAASEKGKAFFQDNEVEMIKNLSKSGVKLGDVKVALTSDSSSQSFDKNGNNQNNNGFNSKSSQQQFASGRQESGRERREELWNLYRERLGA